ncbi:uncharacterized protein TEOVI_000306000 [Trypanosoma equiperdum]|nr:hypothetical protein, conserved [Trypanosoma equiperdum]
MSMSLLDTFRGGEACVGAAEAVTEYVLSSGISTVAMLINNDVCSSGTSEFYYGGSSTLYGSCALPSPDCGTQGTLSCVGELNGAGVASVDCVISGSSESPSIYSVVELSIAEGGANRLVEKQGEHSGTVTPSDPSLLYSAHAGNCEKRFTAFMVDSVINYLVEGAGTALEALAHPGLLSYSTIESTLSQSIISVAAAAMGEGGLSGEWRAGLSALAERLASDYITVASREKLQRLDEFVWYEEAFLSSEEALSRSAGLVSPQCLFGRLQPSDIRFLAYHYTELVRKGTNNAEDFYCEARLRENLFERNDGNGALSSSASASLLAVGGEDGLGNSGTQRSLGSPCYAGSRAGTLGMDSRRAGITQLVLGHALENLLEEMVGDAAKWVASLSEVR